MLKLDQMRSFPDLNMCLASALYRVFHCSASYFGMFLPPEKKVIYRWSVSYWVWSEDFLHSDRISMEGFFFFFKSKGICANDVCHHTKVVQNKTSGTACIQRCQPYGFCIEAKLLQ